MSGMLGRALGMLSALAVLITGAYGTWFWVMRDTGPRPEAFAPAAEVIRNGWQTGDLLMLVPFYATRARLDLGDLLPVAVRDPLTEDFATRPRVWVMGLFGEGEKLRPRMIAAGMKLASTKAPAPGITVDLYETGARAKATYSFVEHLRDAKVYHEKDGQRVPCAAWNVMNGQGGMLGRWTCPYDSDWFYVAPEWHQMGEQMRFCLWAHPPRQGRLVIAYPDVPLTGEIAGRAGHTQNATVFAHAPVMLDVEVTDLAPQRFVFQLEDNWKPFALQLPSTGTATVAFAVSTPDNGSNHFCFDAAMRTEVGR
jgi:hypothetical protein